MSELNRYEADKLNNSRKPDEEARALIADVPKDPSVEPRVKDDNALWQMVTRKNQNRRKGSAKKIKGNGQNHIENQKEAKDLQNEKVQYIKLTNRF